VREIFLFVSGCLLVACGVAPEKRAPATFEEIAALAAEIRALGPEVDPEEAMRAARISYERTRELAIQYEIVDPPLIHNTKVNMGLKPRGLCWHWAEDMESRLKEENFETLVLYRAIANADNPYRIDHSTAIIAAKAQACMTALSSTRGGPAATCSGTRCARIHGMSGCSASLFWMPNAAS
jgi:hypothetical protein